MYHLSLQNWGYLVPIEGLHDNGEHAGEVDTWHICIERLKNR